MGCAHIPLKRNTQRQVRTVADIQQQQVLDNIAMFVASRDAIPFLSLPNSGGTSVTQSGNSTVGLNWNPTTLIGESLNMNASGSLSENWVLSPINNPDRLALMKCVYQYVTCRPDFSSCVDCDKELRDFFGADFALCDTPACWFGRGTRRDVPKDACFVARNGKTWVWVTAENRTHLANVTLAILNIATIDAAAFAAAAPETVEIEETFTLAGGREIKGKYSISTQDYENLQRQVRSEASRIKAEVRDPKKWGPNAPTAGMIDEMLLPDASGIDLNIQDRPGLQAPKSKRFQRRNEGRVTAEDLESLLLLPRQRQ